MTVESAQQIEALLAKPYPTRKDLEEFCNHARLENYRSVVVPSSLVEHTYDLVADEGLKICCLIGYPFGGTAADVKRFEVELAVDAGAHEIELVPGISVMLEGRYSDVLREIRDVVEAADERPVRVSIELPLWSDDQLAEIVRTVLESGAQFISTSIAPPVQRPVVPEDIAKLRALAGSEFGIKVGGLRNNNEVDSFLEAGANYVGLLI